MIILPIGIDINLNFPIKMAMALIGLFGVDCFKGKYRSSLKTLKKKTFKIELRETNTKVMAMNDNGEQKLLDVISKVLTMNGISKVRHNSYISNVLNITTSAGYKKLTGATKWEVLQLVKVVESLGITMSDFFDIYDQKSKEIHHGVWRDAHIDRQCKIYLMADGNNVITDLSAVKIGDVWNIIPFSELNKELLFESRRSVESITIYPKQIQSTKNRIALLDDDKLITESLYSLLKDDDYQIDTFNFIDELDEQVSRVPYDLYVLDWVVGERNCFQIIKNIRGSSRPDAMIIVLTGKLAGINDDEISEAIHDYDIVGPFEKPLKSGIIKSNIDKFFAK